MNVPSGNLLQARVVQTPAPLLADALDRELTGYLRIAAGETLLLEGYGRAVITLVDGVPRAAYHTGKDVAGNRAIETIPELGPYHVELYRTDQSVLKPVHTDTAVQIPPGRPAERLAEDPTLAERTRTAASPDHLEQARHTDEDRLAAFLEDEKHIQQIKQEARQQAQTRAEEWGLTGELTEQSPVKNMSINDEN